MTKRYKILQKKLQELEAEALQVITLPPETPCRHLISAGIEQKLIFLTNLLTAEIASHPSKPHHLTHIAERLAGLETAFHDWDDGHRTLEINNFDIVSTCSCTESCLNDDGDGSPELGSLVDEDLEPFPEAVEEETAVVVAPPETGVKKVEGMRVWVWVGMVVGAVLMVFGIIGFYGSFGDVEHSCFVTPT